MQINFYLKKRISKWVLVLGVLSLLVTNSVYPGLIHGDELEDLENDLQNTRNQIQEYEKQLNSTKAAVEAAKKQAVGYQGALRSYSGQLEYAKAQLIQTTLELDQKQIELDSTAAKVKEATLSAQYHEGVLKDVVRDFYKKTFNDEVSYLLVGQTAGDVARTFVYRERVSDGLRAQFFEIVDMLQGLLVQQEKLAIDKQGFEKQREELLAQQAHLERQIVATSANLATAQGQETQLSQTRRSLEEQIGELTQKEQQLLSAKSAITNSTNTVGEIETGLQKVSAPSAANLYSVWTYGHPHQVGMSQYGAYGRALAGQNYSQILLAYFSNVTIEKFWNDEDVIPVQGMGDMSMKEYLYRLGEMPEGWGNTGGYEALKAQAIAARTFALNYIYYAWNGLALVDKSPTPICTTQSCQVIGNPKTGKWKQAVDETEGMVILYSGKPITAWYSASAGGFVLSSEEQWGGARPWAQGKNDFDPQGFAYDGGKYINPPSGSPYYPWIANGNDASNQWLGSDIMEDIFNATLLPESYKSKLYNPEYDYKKCTPPGGTADGLTTNVIREILISEGIQPVSGLIDIQNVGQNSKQTQLLKITDQFGVRDINAQLFRDAFRRRAPGCYDIPTKRFEITKS